MGWCGGTDIFDAVVESLKKEALPNEAVIRIIKVLVDALWGCDWDCERESIYYNNPLVKKAFEELYPGFYDE